MRVTKYAKVFGAQAGGVSLKYSIAEPAYLSGRYNSTHIDHPLAYHAVFSQSPSQAMAIACLEQSSAIGQLLNGHCIDQPCWNESGPDRHSRGPQSRY